MKVVALPRYATFVAQKSSQKIGNVASGKDKSLFIKRIKGNNISERNIFV